MDMEIWQMILLAVGGIVGAGIVIALIIRLLMSYMLTRILTLGLSIASIVMAFPLSKMYEGGFMHPDGNPYPLLIATSICTVLAWICFVGPTVLDVEWDGEWDIGVGFFGEIDLEPHTFSFFFLNLFIAVPVAFVTYFLIAPEMTALFFALPILVIVIEIIAFFIALKNA